MKKVFDRILGTSIEILGFSFEILGVSKNYYNYIPLENRLIYSRETCSVLESKPYAIYLMLYNFIEIILRHGRSREDTLVGLLLFKQKIHSAEVYSM